LFEAGISNELFPLILFIGIGAMIDFGPILSNPKLMIFGAAAQFGIFLTFCLASLFFDLPAAASIGIIGAADGPTAIVVAQKLLGNASTITGAIMVAAYSYMALVPVIQPPIIKLLTTKKERLIRMPYKAKTVSKTTRILFPIVITIIAGLVAPESIDLLGFLMFGNLIRECGVLNSLSETAQKVLANLITIFLGITVATQMTADKFLQPATLLILGLGLVAFIFDTAGGVLFAKFLNLFLKEKINPMIGAAGISAFPMSGRVVHKMGLKEDPQNFLLMHSIGVNVSGQIASVIAGGLILSFATGFGAFMG
jgi:oxaloacetate decarboxylase beta subunit